MSTVGGSNQQPLSIEQIANMFAPENMALENVLDPSTTKLPDSVTPPPIPPKPQLPPDPRVGKQADVKQGATPPPIPSSKPQLPPDPRLGMQGGVRQGENPPPLPPKPAFAERLNASSAQSNVHEAFGERKTHVAANLFPSNKSRVMEGLLTLAKGVGTILDKASNMIDKMTDQVKTSAGEAKAFFSNLLQKRTGSADAASLEQLAKPEQKQAEPAAPKVTFNVPEGLHEGVPHDLPPPPAPPSNTTGLPPNMPPPPPPPSAELPAGQSLEVPDDLPPHPSAEVPKHKEEMPRDAGLDVVDTDVPAPPMDADSGKSQIDVAAEAKTNPAIGGEAYNVQHQKVRGLVDQLKNNPSATLTIENGEVAVSNRSSFAFGVRAGSSEAVTKLFQELSHLEPLDLATLLGELKDSGWLSGATKNLPAAGKQALAALEGIVSSFYIQMLNDASSSIKNCVEDLKDVRNIEFPKDLVTKLGKKVDNEKAIELKQKVDNLEGSIQKAMTVIERLSQQLDLSDVKNLEQVKAMSSFRIALSDYAPQFKEMYRNECETIRNISTPETNQNLISKKNAIPDLSIDLTALEMKAKLMDYTLFYKDSQSVFQNMQVLAAQLPQGVQKDITINVGVNQVGDPIMENLAEFADVAKYQATIAETASQKTLPDFLKKLNKARNPAEKQKIFASTANVGINKGVAEFGDNVINRMDKVLNEVVDALLKQITDKEAKEKINSLKQELKNELSEISKKKKAIKTNNPELEVSVITVHAWKGPEAHDLHAFQKKFNDFAKQMQALIPAQET